MHVSAWIVTPFDVKIDNKGCESDLECELIEMHVDLQAKALFTSNNLSECWNNVNTATKYLKLRAAAEPFLLTVLTCRSYLPFLLTVLTYRSYLPFLLTVLTYRSYLPFLLTVLTYRSYLPFLLAVLTYRSYLHSQLHAWLKLVLAI